MNRSELKRSLKIAVLQSTPDLLPTLLPGYSAEEVPLPLAVAEEALCGINQPAVPRKRPQFQLACVMAAVCVMFLSVFYLAQPKVDSIVSIDVNPSIELTIDQNDRVIKSKASNDDAAAILKNMKLRDKDLREATGAIINEMMETGYLSANSTDNAILISVASRNGQKTEQLQEQVSDGIETVLKKNNASAKILRQADTLSDDLQEFASENKVSVGKADLVRKLMQKDSTLDAAELCKMSLKKLNALIEGKNLEISGLVVHEEGSKPADSNSSAADPSSAGSQPGSSKPEDVNSQVWEPSSGASRGGSSSRPQQPSSSQGESSWSGESSDGAESKIDDTPPDIEDPDGVPEYPFDDPNDVSSAVPSKPDPSSSESSSKGSSSSVPPASSSASSAVSEKPASSSRSSTPESSASSRSSSQKASSGSSDKSEASPQKSASSQDKK